MQTQTTFETKPIRLEDGSEGLVIIISDSDRFCITRNEAARACRTYDRNNALMATFEIARSKQYDWLRSDVMQIPRLYKDRLGSVANLVEVYTNRTTAPATG